LFNRLSVRRKFLFATVAVVLLVAAFTAIYYPALLQKRTMDGRRDQVVNLAETVALGVGIGLGLSELSVVATTFEWARRDKALLYVQVTDEHDVELGGYNPNNVSIPDHENWDGKEPYLVEIGDRLDVAVPVSHGGEELGRLYLGVSLTDIQGRISADRRTGLAASGLILFVGILLSLFLAAKVVRPLEILRDAADKIAEGDLSVRVATDGRDEVATLGKAFNSMSARLSETVEELATARDAALEGTRAKANFLATMSHEIRTPMNGVLGMLDILRRTELSEDQSSYVATAYGSAESLVSIINDILDYSKMEAGKFALEAVDFALRDTVEDVCSLMAGRANAKGVELVCSVEDNVPTVVTGDEGRLRQILINLTGNAIKFTAMAGEVLVGVEVLHQSEKGATVRFSVTDDGIGISQEAQRRLFQPFQQADASTTRRFGGTGLGLSISRRLVEAMGGEIGVESELGAGSTFWFEVPLPTSPDSVEPSTINLTGVRALIVDDHATNRRVLQNQLEGWGMQTTVSKDGPTALATLQALPKEDLPAVAILDMQMPGMDGLALAEVIRKNPLTSNIKMILATSVPDETRPMPQNDPFEAKLAKPLRQASLLRAIASAVASSSKESAAVPPVVARQAPPEVADVGASLQILLVEDNPVNQMVARVLLEEMGHEIDIADNGQVALDRMEDSTYDLVLMDCQMPIMDGFEATREIRRRESQDSRIPIIAMTANALEEDRQKCLDAGMDDHLAKPVNMISLAETISRAVDGLDSTPSPDEP
jgi:signal transduction histidine kinase/DNA-binding response OmpR family regulator